MNQQLAKELGLKINQVEEIIKLIDEGNTIPFIARYRKEVTGGASDEVLRDFEERLKYLRNLDERKSEILRIIEEQGKLTEELRAEIQGATVLQRLEDLYRPYKQKKRTRATIAKEKGLEPLALILLGTEDKTSTALAVAEAFINMAAEKEELNVPTAEAALEGANDILAEMFSDNAEYRTFIREFYLKNGVLITKATKPNEQSVYEMYYDYSEPISKMPSHRILAVNRAEKEEWVKAQIEVGTETIQNWMVSEICPKANPSFDQRLVMAVEDALKRLIFPSIEREVRNIATEKAEVEAISVFGKNTKPLLMQAPVMNVKVLAIDPGYRTGCKVTVLDETGKLLEYATIYPTEPRNDIEGSKKVLKTMIEKYQVDIVSIGNGTGSRETESVVADLLKTLERQVFYTIVSEAGASVYSASKLATEEYPDLDVSIRGAISIGRRLQDPLAELVKIDPKSIGVGQYQHDLNQKNLDETLKNVVEDCVNSVGVDLNMATPSLLKYVSGINETIAKNIVAYRDENGRFKSRKELKKVKRLGDKAFEQCAGFLRIREGAEPLDNTAVHPESYDLATRLMTTIGYGAKDLKKGSLNDIEDRLMAHTETKQLKDAIRKMAETLEVGTLTLTDIVAELKKPGRDPREDMPKPIFRSDVLSFNDLAEGMELMGTVRNVANFGAFVDIGVKTDGLVHVSQLADKFVKNPMDVVSVGDVVKVKIIGVDKERKKISMTMKGLSK